MRLRIISTSLLLLIIGAAAGTVGYDAAASAALSEFRGSTLKPQAKRSRCRKVPRVKPRSEHLRRPPQTIERNDHLLAVIETNCGRFRIKLDARSSPAIVNSFAYLARSHFYDGLWFYRVVPNFIIQGATRAAMGTEAPATTSSNRHLLESTIGPARSPWLRQPLNRRVRPAAPSSSWSAKAATSRRNMRSLAKSRQEWRRSSASIASPPPANGHASLSASTGCEFTDSVRSRQAI
jgi:cyclophilin family peptidyl-prolyl cis-trans isomerase